MYRQPEVSYIPCDTSSKEKTGNIIMFAQFEDGNLPLESCIGTEIGDTYDNNETVPPLIIEA